MSAAELTLASETAAVADFPLGQRRTFVTFTLFTLLMVFDFADRMILSALIPSIQAQWQISDATAGLLSSILTLGMVLFAFPVSIAIDRWSRVKTAALMGIVWSIASAAGGFVQSVGQLLASRARSVLASPVTRRRLMRGFPRRFQNGAGNWRWGFFPPRNRQTQASLADAAHSRAQAMRAILRTPSLLFAYLAGAMSTLQWATLQWVPLQQATTLISTAILFTIVSIPLGGWIMDRWNLRNAKAKLLFPLICAVIATLGYVVAFREGIGQQLQFVLITLGFVFCAAGGIEILCA